MAAILWERQRKERDLVTYLKGLQSDAGTDKGQRSALHLTARLGLTEDEILHARASSDQYERNLL